MGINQFQAPRAPIEGILQGLQAVHNYYGINTERQRQALQDIALKNETENADPNSAISKGKQSALAASISVANKMLGPNSTPEAQKNLAGLQENLPNLSGKSIDSLGETNPILKMTMGYTAAQGMQNKFNTINDTKKELQQNTIHEGVLKRIDADPNVRARYQQYQNLSNSLSLLANADHITPQQFDEAQQSIRSNLGIKGTSGVDERGHTYLNSMGLNAERWGQMLSGKPASMDPNDPFIIHVKQLANIEQKNIQKQATDRIVQLAGGNSWLYNQRPDLKADLDAKIQGAFNQFQAPAEPSSPSQPGAGIPSIDDYFKSKKGGK